MGGRDTNLLLAQLIASLIDSLWSVARARYLNHPLDRVRVVTDQDVDGLLQSPTRTVMRDMRFTVLRELPPPDQQHRRRRPGSKPS